MSRSVKSDLLKHVPVVSNASAAIGAVAHAVKRLLGPSQGQVIADALRDGLHEYVQVADKYGIARLIEAHARFLEAAARFEEARAAAYATARKADAEYLRAKAIYNVVMHGAIGRNEDDDAPEHSEYQVAAMEEIVALLREFVGEYIADFDTVIAQRLIQLPPRA